MPVDIRLEVFGDVQLNRRLMRLSTRGADMRPVFRSLRDDFYKIETEQFDTEGARSSGGWAPLRPSTLARKRALRQDPRILHATLAMRRSLTRPNAKGSRWVIRKDEFFVGTAVKSKSGFPYPAVHQRPIRSRLPRRRPVELTKADRERWVKRLQVYLVTGNLL